MAAYVGIVWATLLMCVTLGAGQVTTIDSLERQLFPKGSLPPSVRIYCRQDATLNVAVRDGKVVLANEDCKDLSQKWYPVYAESSLPRIEAELKPFSLLNAQTRQVITIPSGNAQKVGLSRESDVNDGLRAARVELWTPQQPTRADEFYKLFVTKNRAFTLNGLGGGVRVGTAVGISSASATSGNAIWKLTSYPPCSP